MCDFREDRAFVEILTKDDDALIFIPPEVHVRHPDLALASLYSSGRNVDELIQHIAPELLGNPAFQEKYVMEYPLDFSGCPAAWKNDENFVRTNGGRKLGC